MGRSGQVDGPTTVCGDGQEEPRGRGLVESLVELQQKERSRIAFDLHDGPAQTIATGLLQVRLLKAAPDEDLRPGLDDVEGYLLTALEQLYDAMDQLRSKALDREHLVQKLNELSAQFAKRTGIDVSFTAEDSETDLSDSLQIALFQIVHEALQNVARHSGAKSVAVHVRITPDHVEASIVDDGKGLEPADGGDERKQPGYGLICMRERARLLGGECTINGPPGEGCSVKARIPVWEG